MIVIVQRHLGDVPLDTIKGALDEIIAILKNEGYKDSDRKAEIESIIDRLSEQEFNSLTVLGQQLTDYVSEANSSTSKCRTSTYDF